MEYVEALRDIKQINSMKRYLKKHSERDYVLFVFGINTGLKINELLDIKVGDVLESENCVKEFLLLTSNELKSPKEIYLNQKVKKAVLHFIEASHLNKDDYLFKSSKTQKPITRQQAYRIIHQAAEAVGIKGKIGTNSMRKTFGYHAYKRGVAISLLQKYFNHATPSETLKYLGISKDEKIRTEIDVNL
ncbi:MULTISPECIES: tyrosine-type recombinase/integrase [Neobacillus]|jgi:site-specific recombinase XerD|uniref:Tyrosine-type recombinase/integrase n=1 Tax=Neobacillus sedimentimangrovi TaxID=2699460 RepID=A0ABS8QJ09_9BACI|nr:tyrosine-type recombinase/integrase [Neobacillus sedimentimangrovi]AIM17052.1 integrase [Bacillus sp. X1(2014)]MCD4839244.1 tyrosine-type recombinase/integrase [Neobacillus sedimentimangrovi]